MDRISHLPDFILHHILSFFTTVQAPVDLVRMSVLSKKWFNLTASFPILNFHSYAFRSRQSFYKYVEYTTSRFCHQNLTAHTFKLSAIYPTPAELDIVNHCLELVLKNGVRELQVYISNLSDVLPSSIPMPKYRLPNILLSVSVLQSLSIRGCELPSSLMLDVVKFKSLIRLELEYVHIDDEVIKYLTTSCPLLQVFHVKRCHGFKRFCVYGHQNLQEVFIFYNTSVERIDIEAPNLSVLYVSDMNERGAPPMNLASCKKLTTVSYSGYPLPNSNGFIDFLSNFPFIENLFLVTNYKCNNLKFSSHSLRTLVLRSNYDLEEIEFNTPNLAVFNYSCIIHMLWPKVWDSTHLKACMQCYPGDDDIIDSLWFHNLRLFLDKKSGFKVLNLYISAGPSRKLIGLENLKAIGLQPYDLEHVELQLDTRKESSESDHAAFVDAVLWCCRPRSLTLRSTDFEEQSDIVKFTYEKLLQQEVEGHTNVQIVSPFSSKARKHFRGLMPLPYEPYLEVKAISFIKEEVVQEEAV